MANINIKYENWKNKLLDLGKGNKLMNFKETKSTFRITYPKSQELFDMLVNEEKEIVFPYEDPKKEVNIDGVDSNISDEVDSTNENTDEFVEYSYLDSNVRTNKSVNELQKILRGLRAKAKIANEEQGVNFLYLVFGFMRWSEIGHSDYVYNSPVLLVPVSLTIESITSPYKLKLHEDEIVVNPTLAYKMSNDFGINLPTYDENKSLSDLFSEIRKMIKPNKWEVVEDVSIGILSFLKINMYTDLNNHKDTILANPIVRALGGEKTESSSIPDGLLNFDFDKNEKPQNVFQVVDADGSQQEAILLAKNGVSFVLQGPPGTGKSQTITNIIAECLADGKKILFVSEKMAALDVVHKRLASAGLDDFCLVLHSNKANKRNVLDQLERTLMLSHKKSKLSEEANKKLYLLQNDIEHLNDYAEQVYEKVEPLGKSIFEVNGILANLEPYKNISFSIQNVSKTTYEQFEKYTYIIGLFIATIGKMTKDYKDNPWNGSSLKNITNEFRHDAGSRLPTLIKKIDEFIGVTSKVFEDTKVGKELSFSGVQDIIKLFEGLDDYRSIPTSWVIGENVEPFIKEIEIQIAVQNKCYKKAEEIASDFMELGENKYIEVSTADELKNHSSVNVICNNLKTVFEKNEMFSSFVETDMNKVVSSFEEARETALKLNDIQSRLLERFEKAIFELDYESILKRLKTEYNSIFKSFKSNYKEDKKSIQECCKDIKDKISSDDFIFVIENLRDFYNYKNWFCENSLVLSELFGNYEIDENTSFDLLEKEINTFFCIILDPSEIRSSYF